MNRFCSGIVVLVLAMFCTGCATSEGVALGAKSDVHSKAGTRIEIANVIRPPKRERIEFSYESPHYMSQAASSGDLVFVRWDVGNNRIGAILLDPNIKGSGSTVSIGSTVNIGSINIGSTSIGSINIGSTSIGSTIGPITSIGSAISIASIDIGSSPIIGSVVLEGDPILKLAEEIQRSGCVTADSNSWDIGKFAKDEKAGSALVRATYLDPLGKLIAERFGVPFGWKDRVLEAYLDYLFAGTESNPRAGARSMTSADAEDNLAKALAETGETSTVTIQTEQNGAKVMYVPCLFAKSQEPEKFTVPTTPAAQSGITIGRYCIWTRRADEDTSPKDDKYWVISSAAGPFVIKEK